LENLGSVAHDAFCCVDDALKTVADARNIAHDAIFMVLDAANMVADAIFTLLDASRCVHDALRCERHAFFIADSTWNGDHTPRNILHAAATMVHGPLISDD